MRTSPLRVALLCSHRAPGLSFLLNEDVNRGSLYNVVCCLSSEERCPDLDEARRAGIPCVWHPIRPLYAKRGVRVSDLAVRSVYDARTAEAIDRFRPDLVVLAGYLYVLTGPMLSAFPDGILNAHDSDLTRVDERGAPCYVGLRSVRDAVFAGEPETRATVHLVTAQLDQGPPLVRSWAFPVAPLVRDALTWRATDILNAYAFAHREWMMRLTWGPLLAASIGLVAQGRVRFDAERAWIDGVPGPLDLPARENSGKVTHDEAMATYF